MGVLYSNNAYATLAADADANAVTFALTSGNGTRFPQPTSGQYLYLTLTNAQGAMEIVKVTARSSDTLTVSRAAEGTTALAWKTGDRVDLRPTAAGLNEKANWADVTATFYTMAQSDARHALLGSVNTYSNAAIYANAWPQVQLVSSGGTATAGAAWRMYADGSNFVVARNTAGAKDFSTQVASFYINSGDVAVFAQRPVFNNATPWDTANLTPLDKNLGGVVGGAMQFNSNVQILAGLQTSGAVVTNGDIISTTGVMRAYGFAGNANSGVIYLNVAADAYHYWDGNNHLFNAPHGEMFFNGQRILHTGNGTSDLVNNSGFLTSIAVAAPRITGTNAGNGFAITGLELADARTVRLVGQYNGAAPYNGGQGG